MSQPSRPWKLLVIEDDPLVRSLYRAALTPLGCEIIEAATASAALATVLINPPDLVLMDLRLPDGNGIRLGRQLRRFPATRSIPIIALSGMSAMVEASCAPQTPFDACLLKPISPAALRRIIQQHLPTQPAPAPAAPRPTVLVVDDDPIQRKRLEAKLEESGFAAEAVSDPLEVVATALRCQPAAIISDVLMPGMDGFALCREIRAVEALQAVPILLTSPHHIEAQDRKLAQELGAVDLILQTPASDAIISTLQELLRQPAAPAASAPAASGPNAILNGAEHLQRVTYQLERQAWRNHALLRQSSILEAQLASLSGVTEVLGRSTDLRTILREASARYLDARGLAMCAIFLQLSEGLSLAERVGVRVDGADGLADLFGHPEVLQAALQAPDVLVLPGDGILPGAGSGVLPGAAGSGLNDTEALLKASGYSAMLLAPMRAEGETLGVVVMAAMDERFAREGIAFLKAATAQLTMAVVLERTRSRLKMMEESFRRLAESLPQGVITATDGWTIQHMNGAAERLFGGNHVGAGVRNLLSASPAAGSSAADQPDKSDEIIAPVTGSTLGVSRFELRDAFGQRQSSYLVTELDDIEDMTDEIELAATAQEGLRPEGRE